MCLPSPTVLGSRALVALLLLVLSACLPPGLTRSAAPPPPVDGTAVQVTVGSTIVAANPERFGANLAQAHFLNQYTIDSGMEPIAFQCPRDRSICSS